MDNSIPKNSKENTILNRFPYLAKYIGTTRDLWMISVAFGIIGGSYLSSYLGGSISKFSYAIYSPHSAIKAIESIIGGIVIVFGSRLAGGCTSGHGISGVSGLSLASLITTASIFIGGILFANIFFR